MIGGVLLRDVLRAPLKLVFTSAAQRDHQPFTKWLIRRMDAVIATNQRSGSFLEVPHTVILHGIDLDEFHPAQSPRTRFRLPACRASAPSAASAGSATRRAPTCSSTP